MTQRINITGEEDDFWMKLPDYPQLVATLGEVLVQEDYGDYQGDSLYLIRNREDYRYGVLPVGWGSCSGCDALQSVDNQKDLDDLQDDLERSVKWFDNLTRVKSYLLSDGLKYSYLDDDLVLNFGSKIVKMED